MILNAFSLNMVKSFPCNVMIEEITVEQARFSAHGRYSAVGHEDTARVFSTVLGMDGWMFRTTGHRCVSVSKTLSSWASTPGRDFQKAQPCSPRELSSGGSW